MCHKFLKLIGSLGGHGGNETLEVEDIQITLSTTIPKPKSREIEESKQPSRSPLSQPLNQSSKKGLNFRLPKTPISLCSTKTHKIWGSEEMIKEEFF
jgi:hypothetical protein